MASKEDFEAMLGRAVTDQTFREQLISDPTAAANTMGFTLTDEQQTVLKEHGSDIVAGAEELERRLAKWHAIVGGIVADRASLVSQPASFQSIWQAGNIGRQGGLR